jgi:hypothetical protein
MKSGLPRFQGDFIATPLDLAKINGCLALVSAWHSRNDVNTSLRPKFPFSACGTHSHEACESHVGRWQMELEQPDVCSGVWSMTLCKTSGHSSTRRVDRPSRPVATPIVPSALVVRTKVLETVSPSFQRLHIVKNSLMEKRQNAKTPKRQNAKTGLWRRVRPFLKQANPTPAQAFASSMIDYTVPVGSTSSFCHAWPSRSMGRMDTFAPPMSRVFKPRAPTQSSLTSPASDQLHVCFCPTFETFSGC